MIMKYNSAEALRSAHVTLYVIDVGNDIAALKPQQAKCFTHELADKTRFSDSQPQFKPHLSLLLSSMKLSLYVITSK